MSLQSPTTSFSGKPKIRLQTSEDYSIVSEIVKSNGLNTVCESARCPNIGECWGRGTATFMILGDVCTRACGFCSVKTGKPSMPNAQEPFQIAMAVKAMKLKHTVITSVDRDDLKYDFGAGIWVETVRQIRTHVPNCTVEVLTPDFQGFVPALQAVFSVEPDIFSHNIECVERVSNTVRTQANWQRSMDVLRKSVDNGLVTKTGIMVGLGEQKEEVVKTMEEVVKLGVEIFTIGQYLQPTKEHLPVVRYVEKDEFDEYTKIGHEIGFRIVVSGPLVRSSYKADEHVIKGVLN